MGSNKLCKYCFRLIIISQLFLSSCNKPQNFCPILILATEKDFGTYTGEIMHAEGFNEFTVKSVFDQNVDYSSLRNHDVVILAQHNLGAVKSQMLRKYVKTGGNIIAFCPDRDLYDLFGIKDMEGNISDGYISIDTLSEAGKGLPGQTIRIHCNLEEYTLKEGKKIASIYEDASIMTKYPALVSNSFGSGHTFAFSYNLPESIIYTRQGNPLAAGKETDGIDGLRAMDLFTGKWVDTSNNIINQADIQMNLLSHCIELINGNIKPLPRFWYFPEKLKCLVTLTNDGEYRSDKEFETQFSEIDSLNAKMTLYILETDKVSKDWSWKWISRGFEISGHPDNTNEAGSPQWSNMYAALKSMRNEISTDYGTDMNTVVNHWFVWCGTDSTGIPEFAAQAMIEAEQGLGMDINYAHYDNGSAEEHFLGTPGLNQGNFTGSGLVMKFADSRGNILNIYQHLNNVYDQQYNELNDPDGFFQCFKGLMDRSLNHEVYSYISIKSHNDEYYFSRIPLFKMIIYATENGVPVWTATNLLDFLRARDEAAFTDIDMKGQKLSFRLNSFLIHESGLTFMVPAEFNSKIIKMVLINREPYPYEVRKFKGKEYAFSVVRPGQNYQVEIVYEHS